MKPRPRLPIPQNQPEEHRYHVAMQHPAADMDADPPTTTTTIPADVRKNMNVLLKMLNDQLEIEVMDPKSRINLVEAMWKAMGYSNKGSAIFKLKKTLIKGIFIDNS